MVNMLQSFTNLKSSHLLQNFEKGNFFLLILCTEVLKLSITGVSAHSQLCCQNVMVFVNMVQEAISNEVRFYSLSKHIFSSALHVT